MTLTKYCFDIQIVGQQCDANFSLNKPLVNLAEIDSDSIKIDIRYFGPENFVGTRDSTAYQWLVTTSFWNIFLWIDHADYKGPWIPGWKPVDGYKANKCLLTHQAKGRKMWTFKDHVRHNLWPLLQAIEALMKVQEKLMKFGLG